MPATLDSAKLFSATAAAAKTTAYKDKVYKLAWDKAQQYVDHQELPTSWDSTQLLGNADLGDSDEVFFSLRLCSVHMYTNWRMLEAEGQIKPFQKDLRYQIGI